MAQPRDARRVPVSLVTCVAWTLVTVFGMRWASDGTPKPLVESVTLEPGDGCCAACDGHRSDALAGPQVRGAETDRFAAPA
jgi:hypothetical protein